MREPTKQSPGADRPKPQQGRDKSQATGNKRLAEQIRKILGKALRARPAKRRGAKRC
jgi:hypothetical protein